MLDDSRGGVIKRRPMVKDRVGCVRTTTRNLPEGGHVYGMKSPPDPEGAGEGLILLSFSLFLFLFLIIFK